MLVTLALEASADTDNTYRYLLELTAKRYEQAEIALQTSRKSFEVCGLWCHVCSQQKPISQLRERG